MKRLLSSRHLLTVTIVFGAWISTQAAEPEETPINNFPIWFTESAVGCHAFAATANELHGIGATAKA